MIPQRGDVILVRFPFASGAGGKIRPALVIQNDQNNRRLANVVVAAITTTTHRSGEPTQLLIEFSTSAGRQSGLVKDSVVTCENIATVEKSRIVARIGSVPADGMLQINECLKVAIAIP